MVNYVLVLGGSNFMGKSLLTKLSVLPEYEVHYINRGKTYWNDDIKKIDNLHYTYGNRNEKLDFTKILKYLSKKLGIGPSESEKKWECVIDFCGYHYKEIRVIILINFFILLNLIFFLYYIKKIFSTSFLKKKQDIKLFPNLYIKNNELKFLWDFLIFLSHKNKLNNFIN